TGHKHLPDENRCQAEQFHNKLKRRIEESAEPVTKIFKQGLVNVQATAPQQIATTPTFKKIKTSLYTARNKSYPPRPKSLNDVNIEGIW
ncbi:unnamed protein product, partial [Didymodactylos carnosus]